jgi:amino acid adenylation domain-containing protein
MHSRESAAAQPLLSRQDELFWHRHFVQLNEAFRFADCVLDRPVTTPKPVVVPLGPAEEVLERISRGTQQGRLVVVLAAAGIVLAKLSGRTEVALELPAHPHQAATQRPVIAVPVRAGATVKELLLALSRTLLALDAHRNCTLRDWAAARGFEVGSDVAVLAPAFEGDGAVPVSHALGIELPAEGAASLVVSSPASVVGKLLLQEIGARLAEAIGSFADVEWRVDARLERAHTRTADRLSSFNATDVAFADARLAAAGTSGRTATVVDLFEARAFEHPEATAVICGDRRLSYGELDRLSNRLAGVLTARFGVGPSTIVPSLATRSEWAVVSLLGVMKAGGAFLGLNVRQPAPALAGIVEQAASPVMLCHSSLIETAMDVSPALYAVDLQLPGEDDVAAPPAPANRSAQELAYVVFTSGTTGESKGVMVRHDGLANTVLDHVERFRVGPGDSYLQFMAMSFDGFLLDCFTALCGGAALAIADEDTIADPQRFLNALDAAGATISTITPSYLRVLDTERLARLRLLVSAGEAMDAGLVHALAHRLELYNGYGPSEATINTTLQRIEPGARISIGRPSANKRVHVVNAQFELQPIGVAGELCIGGAGISQGYLGDEALTRAQFVDDPFEPGGRLYRSGDFGAWTPERTLLFKGRADSQVKVNGLRIDTHEIEHALQACAGVADCCVLSVEDSGRGRTQLQAFFRRKPLMELVPSLGEYGLYDPFLYQSMATDPMRVEGYRRALAGRVKGRVVLDPGTGSELVLARHCLDAGAARVYAVEVDDEAYREAELSVARLGLQERIVLIRGDIASIPPLPEPIDVVVSALAGNVSTADGCVRMVGQVKRLVSPTTRFVPNRYVTRIAGIDLAPESVQAGLSDISAHYARALFEKFGRAFDFRLCLQHMDAGRLLTQPGVCEDIRYEQALLDDERTTLELAVLKPGTLTGFVLWLNAYVDDELMIDSSRKTHHLPVYVPIHADGELRLADGDRVALEFERRLGGDGRHPDYRIAGTVLAVDGTVRRFHADTPHAERRLLSHPVYESLLRKDGGPIIAQATKQSSLRAALRKRLPAYMVPHRLVEIDEWPLTAHGKLDRRALLARVDEAGAEREFVPPSSPVEEALCRVWQGVLATTRISIDENLFSLGCDSIRVIQAVQHARREGLALTVSDVMSNPTIRELASRATTCSSARLAPEHAETHAFPASAMQRTMLEAYEADVHRTGVYHCCAVWHLEDAELSEDALVQALDALHAANPSLRTTFGVGADNALLQHLQPPRALGLVVEDRRGLDSSDHFFRECIARDIDEPFAGAASGAPLTRWRCWRTSATSCALMFSFHHAILDGWSGVELRNQLARLYAQRRDGVEGTRLPAVEPISESRPAHVALEQQAEQEPALRDRWLVRLEEPQARALLRPSWFDVAARPAPAGGIASHNVELAPETLAVAVDASRRLGVPLKAIFLASAARAFAVVAGTSGVALAVVMNGRSPKLPDPLRATGLFWNLAPAWFADAQDATPSAAHAQLLELEATAAFPLRGIERLLGHRLLVPSFNFVNFHNADDSDLFAWREGVVNDRFHFPVAVLAAVPGAACDVTGRLRIETRRDIVDAAFAEALADQLQHFVRHSA